MRPGEGKGASYGKGDLPGTANGLCGFAPTEDAEGMCGKPGVIHVWPGEAPDTRADFTVYACSDHSLYALSLGFWDFHDVASGACSIPGALWRTAESGIQGEGRCVFEL